MMKNVIGSIIEKHSEKLQYWYDLLKETMPDYFFKTFSPQQIEEIMPHLFNIDSQAGIQKISRENNIILIYLKSEENNILTTSRMMKHYNISGAVIHESKQKIVVNDIPRTLVIEYYRIADAEPVLGEPRFTLKELVSEYKKVFGRNESRLNEFYKRINWNGIADLSLEKLVKRVSWALEVQDKDFVKVGVTKAGAKELRLTVARSTLSKRGGFFYKIIEAMSLTDFNIERAYFREVSVQDNSTDFKHMPVTVNTLYLTSDKEVSLNSRKISDMLSELKLINWTDMDDLLHDELVKKHGWKLSEANVIRAAGEFVHSQLSFIDRNAYNSNDIYRFIALYEPVMADLKAYFETKFDPSLKRNAKKEHSLVRKIERDIDSISTGVHEKDMQVKNICRCLLTFFTSIEKTNFYVEEKACYAFRLNPDFMKGFESVSENYASSFPEDRPYGVFYFYRSNAFGFQVRFSEIARGGWRTVIPGKSSNDLERRDNYEFARDEIFREVYVLAHTQHMKNKDIYEGGSKMITLLRLEDNEDRMAMLYEAQRVTCDAFMSLINYDKKGKLKDKNIIDYHGAKEIIEIGPDENMYDTMIEWMSEYAVQSGYTLGSGLISGKPDKGINHKEYGVTSFGVHQYLLKTLDELGIDPTTQDFSVKISGGPLGDVAGNELKLLLEKQNGKYIYPNLKVVAITDGPAAAFDPDGLDRSELLRIDLKENLDKFNPDKLSGEGAYIVYSAPVVVKGIENHKLLIRKGGKLQEKMINRDEFMKLFQNNLFNYADVFIPCGGRPSTIDISNWRNYCPGGKNSSRAIVEGANSFITPAARNELQKAGIWIVKDASANKCGVITSSYEILSGLMLDDDEFLADKQMLVKQIMEKLRMHARREADWLFAQFKVSSHKLTELTEILSRHINAKNEAISAYISEHPELIMDQTILEHLPPVFAEKYSDRLARIPVEYKRAIVSVELATRIVYRQSDSLKNEIESVI